MTPLDLPPLPSFATVAVTRPVLVSGVTHEHRRLNTGDRLTVLLHTPGEPLALCEQSTVSRRKVRVPVACLRVVRTAADDPDADDGDHVGGGPVGVVEGVKRGPFPLPGKKGIPPRRVA